MTEMPELDEKVEWAIGFVFKPDRRCGWTVIFKNEEDGKDDEAKRQQGKGNGGG